MKKLLILLATLLPISHAGAVLNIDITEGVDDALPIAVVPFLWSGINKHIDADISKIVTSDLARSGKFSPLPTKDLISKPHKPEDVHFKTWRLTGVDHLVIGEVQLVTKTDYQIQFRLFDVLKGQQVLGYSFKAKRGTLRDIAHRISDQIIKHVTGLSGAFDARISYVTAQQAKQEIVYKLQVADTDGYNPQTLLTSKEPIMSPDWSPDGGQLAYVSFENKKPEIYIHDIHSAERKLVTSFNGINGAPVWSPDGKSMALTLSKDGNPDIYVLSLDDKSLTRITKHWAIDTEPEWMPDGASLVFTSSRGGKPQLYQVMLKSGARPKRLTFEGSYNTNASISPDGKLVAFVQGEKNTYKIAVLYLETGLVDVLTDGAFDESPDFSPNGSMILYASQVNGRAVLAAVSTDGRHKQRLILSDGEVWVPSWAAVKN